MSLAVFRVVCLFPVLAGALLHAQEPDPRKQVSQPRDAVEVLPVSVGCAQEGASAVRAWLKDAEPARQSRDWADRRPVWRVANRENTSPEALKELLERVYRHRSTWQPDRKRPGQLKPMPLRIDPVEGARWADVVASVDLALSAGFTEIQLGSIASQYFVPAAVPEPFPLGASVVAPEAVYAEPVEFGEGEFWPRVVLGQDGALYVGETQLVAPQSAGEERGEAGRVAWREQLAKWRAEAERRDLIEGPEGQERNRARLVLIADRWTPWPEIERVLSEAAGRGIGFERYFFGVAEVGSDPASGR